MKIGKGYIGKAFNGFTAIDVVYLLSLFGKRSQLFYHLSCGSYGLWKSDLTSEPPDTCYGIIGPGE